MKDIDFSRAFIALFLVLAVSALLVDPSVTIFAIEAIGAVMVVVVICHLVKTCCVRRRLYKKYKGWKYGWLDDDFWSASLDDKLWVYDKCLDPKTRGTIAWYCAGDVVQKALDTYPPTKLKDDPDSNKEVAKLADRLHFAAGNVE